MLNLYKLTGFIDLFDIIPNFVFPVFEKDGKLFFQNGHKNRIEEFVEVKKSVYSKLIPLQNCKSKEIIIDQTADPIYAFRKDASKIEFGDASYFQKFFQDYTTEDNLLKKKINDFLEEISVKRENSGWYRPKSAYFYGTGRRKSSVARVRIFPNGTGLISINGRDIEDYFGLETLKMVVRQPLNTTGTIGKVDVTATVIGGGVTGQAGALRHGISRALLEMNPEHRTILKAAGFLTRDPRMKERKKYGLKAARRAPQFSKR